jgi:maltooligosyltrehalose trehalohydrolase
VNPRFGPAWLGDGSVRFALWAPGCETVALELDGAPTAPMHAQSDGWFSLETQAAAGARYRFRIGPELAVPDPAARAQDGRRSRLERLAPARHLRLGAGRLARPSLA